jgi:hypothetical protein
VNPLGEITERPIYLVNHIRQLGGTIARLGGEIHIQPERIISQALREELEEEAAGIVMVLAMEEWGRLWCLMDPEQFFRRH